MEYFPYFLIVLFLAISIPQWWALYASRRLKGRRVDTPESGRHLYYFYSHYCPPCKLFRPTIEAFAEAHPGRVTMLNVEEQAETAQRFGVRGTPAIALVEDGVLQELRLGSQTPQRMERMLQGETD